MATQKKRKAHILWLPAWYPSKVDFLPGDFTHRHAEAVSKFVNVTVLYVTKDPSLSNNSSVVEVTIKGQLQIYRAYYNSGSGMGKLSKIWSVVIHFRLLFKLYGLSILEHGGFRLAHIHISLRQGLFAQWLKWTIGLKYVITEQNSWFMPVGNQFYPRSLLMQKMISSNFKNADAVHVVSQSLGHQLKLKFPFIKTFTTIPNVVDTNIFHHKKLSTQSRPVHFFTITGDIYHKNTDGIIRAFADFIKQGNEGVLQIAGPNANQLTSLVAELSIDHAIKFFGPLKYDEVAIQMQQADVLIFFTRYETFGCVMAESLCCGTPVIASRIPVLEENLEEFKNTLFVPPEDEAQLTKKMIQFVVVNSEFNKDQIADTAQEKYNYENIGKQFFDFYSRILKES